MFDTNDPAFTLAVRPASIHVLSSFFRHQKQCGHLHHHTDTSCHCHAVFPRSFKNFEIDDGSHNEPAYHQMAGAQEGRIGNQVSSTSPCKNGVVWKQDPSTQRSNLLTFSTASQSHCSPTSTTLMRSRRMSREAIGERARFCST